MFKLVDNCICYFLKMSKRRELSFFLAQEQQCESAFMFVVYFWLVVSDLLDQLIFFSFLSLFLVKIEVGIYMLFSCGCGIWVLEQRESDF